MSSYVNSIGKFLANFLFNRTRISLRLRNETRVKVEAIKWLNARRHISMALALIFLVTTCSAPIALARQMESQFPAPLRAMPKRPVARGPRKVNPVDLNRRLPQSASDTDIANSRAFLEPLAPMHSQAVAGENQALAAALTAYKAKADRSDVSDLVKFVSAFPSSRWTPSVELNIAEHRYDIGYFSEALRLWQKIWEETKAETVPAQKAIADEAVSRLLLLHGRLGDTGELESLLNQVSSRRMLGTVETRIKAAKDGLSAQKNRPGKSFKCGPYAINSLLNIGKKVATRNTVVDKTDSTKHGTNLAQVKHLADEVGLHYQMARRSPGAKLIVPCVVHYKLNHFAAIIEEKNGRYHLTDPTFDEKGNLWLTVDALDAEADGYYLIPDGELADGWEAVSESVAANVWGKGYVGSVAGGLTPNWPCIPCLLGSLLGPGGGMATPTAFSMNATLKIQDTPVGYTPAVGPAINCLINYNHMEGGQPSTFTFSNLGEDWSINWVSYLTVDGSNNATVRVRGGGYEIFNYTLPDNIQNPYVPDLMSQAVLTVVSAGVYQRQLPDGSIEVFNQPDGAGRIFMTQVIDPQGNSAYIQYDTNFRLVTITDAIGQVTTFSYPSDTMGDAGFYKVSQITDPFGRSASLAYDPSETYLLSSTDTIGIQSQFSYDSSSSFINLLTTPYGTTSFITYSYPDALGDECTVLKLTLPDQSQAVIRLMVGVSNFQTDYWDRESMALYPLDYLVRGVPLNSQSTFWRTSVSYVLEPVADSVAPPLEANSVYSYAGEAKTSDGDHNMPGYINKPSTIVQGSETSNYQYNAIGHVTQSVDPVGRTFSYRYDANNIDLLEARQTQGGNNDLNGKWIYNNNQHLPNKYIDGSGQLTQYTYNSFGQLTSLTDANGNVTTNRYSPDGLMMQTDGPLPGSADSTTFAYDGLNRLYSSSDSQGYTVYFNYDDADRITLVTYPDGTTEQTIYDRLDAVLTKDRLGRWTQTAFNSLDQPIVQFDPLGRKTEYTWCTCGSLGSLTDPNGNTTTFQHDQLGRLTTKTISDGSTTHYNYDGYGNVTYRIDNKGQETDYSYNLDNTLHETSYHNPLTQAPVYYIWDPNYKRLTSVQNGWGKISYSYNPYIADPFGAATTGGGMLASVSNNVIANSEVTYQYDALGRTTNRQINGSSNSVTWAYDAMNRVTSEANTLGTFAYNYVDDAPGASKGDSRLASIAYPNGQSTKFNYFGPKQDERLLGITNFDPAGKARSQFNYAYDPAGEIRRWQQQNATNTPIRYALNYDKAGQLVGADGSLGSAVPGANQYFYDYDPGANKTSSESSTIQSVRVGGTVTAADVLTLQVNNPNLSGGEESVNYTVQSGDSLSSIAANMAAAICADTNLQAISVNAASSGTDIRVKSASPDVTSYAQSTSGSATETLSIGLSENAVQNAQISLLGAGYASQLDDVLSITVYDQALSGGSETVSYTVPANGTSLSTIASGLASAVNADSSLSAIGVSAYAASQVVSLSSTSSNLTTYSAAVTPTAAGGTETVTFGPNVVGNTTATVGGSATTGDSLVVTVRSPKLSGGQEAVVYSVPSSSTVSSIAAGVSSAINADTNLTTVGFSASSSAAVVSIGSSPTYAASKSSGATEMITLGTTTNGQVSATIGGTITAGDTVTIQSSGGGLSTAVNSTYTILSGDTTSSVAAGLAGLINGNSSLQSAGITGKSAASVVNISFNPLNAPVYLGAVSSGATEKICLAMNSNINKSVLVGGTKTTGDVVSLTVFDSGLSGGQSSVNYTVLSGDTLSSIASGLASAVNASSDLQNIGVSAAASSNIMTVQSNSVNITEYGESTSSGATEAVTIGLNPNGTQTAAIGGTKSTGDVLTISVYDAGLSGGQESVSYTVQSSDTLAGMASGMASAINADSALSAIGVTATVVSTVVNIKSASTNATTYSQSVSSGGTETVTMSPGVSVVGDSYNDLNQLIARSSAGNIHFQGSTNKPVKSVGFNSSQINIQDSRPDRTINYTTSFYVSEGDPDLSPPGITRFYLNAPLGAGDSLGVTAHNTLLPGGQSTATYVVQSSDTYAEMTANFAAAINSDADLQAIGLSATAFGGAFPYYVDVVVLNPTYTGTVSSGATENVKVSQLIYGSSLVSVGGTATTSDTVTITAHFPSLPSGQESVSYTVLSGDRLSDIAAGLSALVNADTNLSALYLGSTANDSSSAILSTATKFTGKPVLSGNSATTVSAVDGDNNVKANVYQTSASNSPSNQSLIYDLNGNLTFDGTKTYVAE